ncbi:aminotransferase class I/II-fold pyridoxal phosphate-dependent enzyme [Mycobacterium sp. MYCO198283]|uniref:aminotransferase class I/II-fold pyridoxal phosphate-dependent enzyme n=1 Tax=Mycobacterium sp. MYCO198283 TaxID=2883505 RepID=UPI001E3D3A04|nr:aminotransferase class I/II-fold pyridoxal phosphate-dependent enzyme [Mycobacterium sp. MYCO198283]MCG5432240.1 aminotransferase class I/II-fold pyridoxal phosphate-dependent enzyme [Mycobacterium sp. MYCO198283]
MPPHRPDVTASPRILSLPNTTRVALAERAAALLREGHTVLRLETMDPAVFDLPAPDPILRDMVASLPSAQGYSEHQGLFSARRAVALHYELIPGFPAVDVTDIWLGNGASELIIMAVGALISAGDEILVPRPCEAIWTAATAIAGGRPVYYDCDPDASWDFDVDAIAAQVTDRTRAIVISNPNNPTGRVYPSELLRALGRLAAKRGLVVLADETLEKVVFPPTEFVPMGVYAPDTLCLTFGSLSFGYRAPGYRAGWLVVSGQKQLGGQYMRALSLLSELRRSSNTPGQHAVQVALGGRQTIAELTAPGGRLWGQREAAVAALGAVAGLRFHQPEGGLSVFVGVDEECYGTVADDAEFAMELLESHHVLVEPGRCFSMASANYFRVTFLARERVFGLAVNRIEKCLENHRDAAD